MKTLFETENINDFIFLIKLQAARLQLYIKFGVRTLFILSLQTYAQSQKCTRKLKQWAEFTQS